MPTTQQHIRVFLASPGDVNDERNAAIGVLARLTSDPFLRGRITVESVAWDHPDRKVSFLAGMSAQDSVLRSLGAPRDSDIVVMILWSRLGSPIEQPQYKKHDGGFYTGTEWEYQNAWQANQDQGKPPLLLYHRTSKPSVEIDPDKEEAVLAQIRQSKQVRLFLDQCRQRDGSIPNEYTTMDQFRNDLEIHLKELILEQLKSAENTAETPDPTSTPNLWQRQPYPGFLPFDDTLAPIFFGRERQVDQLVERLRATQTGFIAVFGASGVGKSSLVWAGLIPRLRQGAIEGSQDWRSLRCTPAELGDDPFVALAAQFAPHLPSAKWAVRTIADTLRDEPQRIAELTALALSDQPASSCLLLFIDQFEELFTVVASEHRAAFVALLAATAAQERLHIVLTVRDDFYQRCLDFPVLANLLNEGMFSLGGPGSEALYDMVTRPATLAGLHFEAGLPERMISETGTKPGALAVLAFTLEALYLARESEGRLTVAAYDSFGGVEGAIGQRANQVFDALPANAQAQLGSVFRELVEVDQHGVPTRRRSPLTQVVNSAAADALVKALIDARLLVSRDEQVEVAHEALFRKWPRLADWIRDTADDHRLRRQLEAWAEAWDQQGRRDEQRWPDDRVVEVERMLNNLGLAEDNLTPLQRDYLGPVNKTRMRAELDEPTTHHQRRATIGVRLSLLDDPRPGVGVVDGIPEITWCRVPKGPVTLEEDAGSFDIEEPFYIAQYPVTYGQYRVFIEAEDGYDNAEWWPDGNPWGKAGRQSNRRDNHPVDNVSWRDASAFCQWLNRRLIGGLRGRLEGVGDDWLIRLPTEWEWQQAATGGDPEREYPWSGAWDARRANTIESELGHSTAVGSYPQGASTGGALDMAGNVWEWCLNEYDSPEKTSSSGNADRVLRGGSWGSRQAYARASYRSGVTADFRSLNTGFRVVCASPL